MALKLSVNVRNSRLDAIENYVNGLTGTVKLRFYSGAVPSDPTAVPGTMLCSITLPVDWMAAASNGSKAKLGSWTGTGDANAGSGTTTSYFRILTDNAGTLTYHLQGTVAATGGSADMIVDNASISSGQSITVTSFQINDSNA